MKKALTSLEYALLGLVQQRPTSGYELCKVFETTPMGHFSSSPGSIYPALKRLEQRAYLAGKVDSSQAMRPRRLFALTAAGHAALVAWVSQPVTRRDVVWAQDELLLRFGFMDALVEKAVIRRFLDELLREAAAELSLLEQHHRGMRAREEPGAPGTGRLALGFGVASYRTLLRWARKARDEFAAPGTRRNNAGTGGET